MFSKTIIYPSYIPSSVPINHYSSLAPTPTAIIAVFASNSSGSIMVQYIIFISVFSCCLFFSLFLFLYYYLRTSQKGSNELYQTNSDGDMVNNTWYNIYDLVDIYKKISSKKNGTFIDVENSFSTGDNNSSNINVRNIDNMNRHNHHFSRLNSLLMRKEMIKQQSPQYIEEDEDEEDESVEEYREEEEEEEKMPITPRANSLYRINRKNTIDPLEYDLSHSIKEETRVQFESLKDKKMPVHISMKDNKSKKTESFLGALSRKLSME